MSAPLTFWVRRRHIHFKILNPPNVGEVTLVSDRHGSLLLLSPCAERALFFRAAELGQRGELKGGAGGVAQLDTTNRKLTEGTRTNILSRHRCHLRSGCRSTPGLLSFPCIRLRSASREHGSTSPLYRYTPRSQNIISHRLCIDACNMFHIIPVSFPEAQNLDSPHGTISLRGSRGSQEEEENYVYGIYILCFKNELCPIVASLGTSCWVEPILD